MDVSRPVYVIFDDLHGSAQSGGKPAENTTRGAGEPAASAGVAGGYSARAARTW